ncbi:MAG: hypothetical protein LBC75_03835 [Fibromonadaceae bacterium]|jgi:Sec-independent protein translocase protein TatA|nr:hypothetical protein [Fibromonadaceae bacterium]
MTPIIICIVIVIVLFFLWSLKKINELHANIASLRNEIEDLKRNQNKQNQEVVKNIEKPTETNREQLQPQKEMEISEPETKPPESTQKKEPFYLGMPNEKGFLKEEPPKAGYFIAQESGINKAFFIFVNDQAKLNVIFKSDMEGKFYNVESGIALPGKALLNQSKGLLGKKGDFWTVLKPIIIELESGN